MELPGRARRTGRRRTRARDRPLRQRGLNVATTGCGHRIKLGGRIAVGVTASLRRDLRPDLRGRELGELLVYQDAYHARPGDQPRRRRGHARRRRGRRGAAAAAMIGAPRVHHRLTDSTNERAKELAARGSAARHARHRRRAVGRARAPGADMDGARPLGGPDVARAARAGRASLPDRGRRRRGRGAYRPAPRSSGRTTCGSTAGRWPGSSWRDGPRRAGRSWASA